MAKLIMSLDNAVIREVPLDKERGLALLTGQQVSLFLGP